MTDLSVIVLTLNEERFIGEILENVLENDGLQKEIIIADAGSTDATLDIATRFGNSHPNVSVYNNTEKYVSKALNNIVPKCKGKCIAILGAHTVYPPHYLSKAFSFLQQNPQFTIVGGPIDHAAISITGKSIAFCMSSIFGMGNSAFRTAKHDIETDTVPFPVYPKHVFDELGGYDNRLIRNQDEDFHYRAVQHGFRIFMLSELRSVYYVRESYIGLIKQFFQYGYFKPLVMKNNGQSIKLRHFIPLFFMLYLALTILLATTGTLNIWVLAPLFLYVIINFIFSFSLKNRNPVISLFNLITFPVMHISYGTGTLFGLFNINK